MLWFATGVSSTWNHTTQSYSYVRPSRSGVCCLDPACLLSLVHLLWMLLLAVSSHTLAPTDFPAFFPLSNWWQALARRCSAVWSRPSVAPTSCPLQSPPSCTALWVTARRRWRTCFAWRKPAGVCDSLFPARVSCLLCIVRVVGLLCSGVGGSVCFLAMLGVRQPVCRVHRRVPSAVSSPRRRS